MKAVRNGNTEAREREEGGGTKVLADLFRVLTRVMWGWNAHK